MKKITSLLLFMLFATGSFAQTDSTYFGKWKIMIVTGEKSVTQSYMLLKNDSTFLTSSDSSFADAKQKVADGKWKVTAAGEIKLIPSDTARDIHYYEHETGWRFKYGSTEKHGIKIPATTGKVEIYIEKMVYVPKEKKSKKRKK
jgi:hypothetical protein